MKSTGENIKGGGISLFGLGKEKITKALKIMDGISRLPLQTNTGHVTEIKRIFGESEKTEKK
jgi:hypothetical protein